MTTPVSLLFGVHAHQPSDNFADVLERAVDRCYRPFLETLDAYPRFRFSFHCSGPLFTFLCDRFPEVVHRLERMVARGQTELFGGGDAEPVLAAIPERDRRGQLRAFSDRLEARFGRRPRGAWLTERAWEATIVPSLAACGIDYVTVDDYHFLCTGRESSELTGYFTTEEDGRRLDLFPISEALRYKIPFAPATDVVPYLEGLDTTRSGVAAIYFDDIEKFGIWPDTHEWVYGRGWLAEFLQGVLASTRIETRTYSEFRAAHRTRGVVYLPSTAYIEMNEWTLPARAAARYAALVRHERALHRYDDAKPFLRGGIWRNFLSRYPEANWLHKRMLALSDRVASLPGPADAALTRLLYAAQANDAYWHGLFGGLYLPHLRRGLYRALIGLEHALDRLHPRPPRGASDGGRRNERPTDARDRRSRTGPAASRPAIDRPDADRPESARRSLRLVVQRSGRSVRPVRRCDPRAVPVHRDVPDHVDHDSARAAVRHARTAHDDAPRQSRLHPRIRAGLRTHGAAAGGHHGVVRGRGVRPERRG
jgi:4-alpha-glucanotransferase/alpha-amylase